MFWVQTRRRLVVRHHPPIANQRGIERPAVLMAFTDQRQLRLFDTELRLLRPFEEGVISGLGLLNQTGLPDPLIRPPLLPAFGGFVDHRAGARGRVPHVSVVTAGSTLLVPATHPPL